MRIDLIRVGTDNQAVHHGGAAANAVGAAELPGIPAERDPAQRPFCAIGQANAAILEEAIERGPALGTSSIVLATSWSHDSLARLV